MLHKVMLLLVCALMALGAPLAQAASCMMHGPQVSEAVEAPCPHHPQPKTATSKLAMSVAECLQPPATPAAPPAYSAAESSVLFILPAPPIWVVQVAPKQTFALRISRAPPPDILTHFGHRRI